MPTQSGRKQDVSSRQSGNTLPVGFVLTFKYVWFTTVTAENRCNLTAENRS